MSPRLPPTLLEVMRITIECWFLPVKPAAKCESMRLLRQMYPYLSFFDSICAIGYSLNLATGWFVVLAPHLTDDHRR
ncbi:hypothetical protein C2U68_07220 [Methylomonas koyamae]|nr:hypothetical protein C2U68_07220 [Methylomonas koyamae]